MWTKKDFTGEASTGLYLIGSALLMTRPFSITFQQGPVAHSLLLLVPNAEEPSFQPAENRAIALGGIQTSPGMNVDAPLPARLYIWAESDGWDGLP
jgi:hypothetical protein